MKLGNHIVEVYTCGGDSFLYSRIDDNPAKEWKDLAHLIDLLVRLDKRNDVLYRKREWNVRDADPTETTQFLAQNTEYLCNYINDKFNGTLEFLDDAYVFYSAGNKKNKFRIVFRVPKGKQTPNERLKHASYEMARAYQPMNALCFASYRDIKKADIYEITRWFQSHQKELKEFILFHN